MKVIQTRQTDDAYMVAVEITYNDIDKQTSETTILKVSTVKETKEEAMITIQSMLEDAITHLKHVDFE